MSALGDTFSVLMAAVGFEVVMTMTRMTLPPTALTEIDEAGMPRAEARALMKAAWLKSEMLPPMVTCCITCGMYDAPGGAGTGGGGDGAGDGGGGDGGGGEGDGGGGEGDGGGGEGGGDGGGGDMSVRSTQQW